MRPAVPVAGDVAQVDAELPGARAHGRRRDRPLRRRATAGGRVRRDGAGRARRRRGAVAGAAPALRRRRLRGGAGRRRRDVVAPAASSTSMRISSDADREHLADLAAKREHLAGDRRRDLDRGLVGHHVGEALVLGDRVAGCDVPGDELDLGDAFADVGHADARAPLIGHGLHRRA